VLNTMFYQKCGDRLTLTILRSGQTQALDVVVAPRPARPSMAVQMPVGQPTIVPAAAESPQ